MTTRSSTVLKVVLVGEYGVGKSSLFRRFVHDTFVEVTDRASTLGFDHFERNYVIDGRDYVLQLWDTGGLERVASVTSSYFKGADGALLVFAFDQMESLHALSQHLLEVVSSAENAKLFLCGNKTDMRPASDAPSAAEFRPNDSDLETFAREHQISPGHSLFAAPRFLTSCKLRHGVFDMFEEITRVLARSSRPAAPDPDHFRLRANGLEPQKKSLCSGCSE